MKINLENEIEVARSIAIGCFWLLAGILIVGGLAASCRDERFDPLANLTPEVSIMIARGMNPHQFAGTDALGAIANATQWTARHPPRLFVHEAVWLGLALIAIALLSRLMVAAEALAAGQTLANKTTKPD